MLNNETTLPALTAGESPPPLPRKIGPYKIESFLGKGGMSFLFLAIHPATLKPLVIKVLSPKHLQNKEMVARFLKEAQIISMTHHPNIITLYGQGQWERGLYIATEFIQGVSLRQFIQKKSLLTQRSLEIVLQVAYALCHLHMHGVIHRDLKPENILITENGEVKIIDFGIAMLAIETESTQERLIGTPVYMSPEQKENPSQATYASDIYSLGIIAYELLLGRFSHGIIQTILLPKHLRSIIDKALEIPLEMRYSDIVDFITDVTRHVHSVSTETDIR